MVDLTQYNPTGRFSGLQDLYAKYRPDYPPAALDYILTECSLGGAAVLVDVGCGTGISSRLFAARGLHVIGIDPNEAMRTRAAAEPPPSGGLAPVYRAGRAEATGLPDGTADSVLAAQAFHWFDPVPTLAEFHRILKPGGWAVLMWNERDEADPFTAVYGAVLRTLPDTAAVEVPRLRAGDALFASPLFGECRSAFFGNGQALDEEGLLGRAFSASYAPKEPARAEAFARDLRTLFARHQAGGTVTLRYQTSVYLGRRREVP
jgi:SAM-dependent methyltransferase